MDSITKLRKLQVVLQQRLAVLKSKESSTYYSLIPDTNFPTCSRRFDTRNPIGTCDCGAGRVRVPGSTTECQFAAMNGQCWLLSFSMTYGTPSAGASGFPYIADANGGQRIVKRGIPETGTVGQNGGSIAYASTADPNGSATVGCLEE
jgi:hypothetical protein